MRQSLAGSVALILVAVCGTAIAAEPERWWPEQRVPKSLVRTSDQPPESPHDAYQMLLQSIAGLAAQGVNEGRSDELVWIGTTNPSMKLWYASFMNRHPSLASSETIAPWDLVERGKRQGLIKGYILYRHDTSSGELNDHRKGIDCSVNVATSLAGLLGGVLVDERIEKDSQAHGLKLLVDARDKTQAWCFATYREKFNRRLLCVQDPKKPHTRDLAIAQRALTLYGDDEPLQEVLAWLEPLSPMLGWNGGDEFETTRLTSIYGHIQTATDWCWNLPVLMAGSAEESIPIAKPFDPRSIDWTDRRSGVCFIDTDGDNVQWLEGNFFHEKSYWANPDRGKLPFGWSCCFAHLAQLCPQAIRYAVETRTPNDSFVEWGGGYYYPDLFAQDRPDRWKLLADHARRTWSLMRRTGTRIIGFNVAKIDSPDALQAYRTFASETDGLLAMLAFQYDPYEGGAGKTFWVKDRNGVEIPVITARYSIWSHPKKKVRSGTPAQVAREIRETVQSSTAGPRFDWVTDHVWSYFRRAPGADELAENLPQTDAEAKAQGGVRGYSPMTWCAERLGPDIRVISPEELAWRLRMERNPEQTAKEIGK